MNNRLTRLTLRLLVVCTHRGGSWRTSPADDRLEDVVAHCRSMVHRIAVIDSVGQIITEGTLVHSCCTKLAGIRITRFQTTLRLTCVIVTTTISMRVQLACHQQILLRSLLQARGTSRVDVSGSSILQSGAVLGVEGRVYIHFILLVVVHNLILDNRATRLANHLGEQFG